MRNFLFLSIAFVFSSLMKKDSGNKVIDMLSFFTSDPFMVNASITFKAVDLETGAVLASHNPDLTIQPASVTKLFTTAMALDQLGGEFTPKTRFYKNGILDQNGTLNGDLWIRGAGDPSFASRYFYDVGKENVAVEKLIDTLKFLGIKKINGNIIADASEFGYEGVPDGWNWTDMGNYYGAGPSGLTFQDNILKLYFKTGKQGATITKMEPQAEGMTMANFVTAGNVSGDNTYVYGSPYSLDRFITGELPKNATDFIVKASVPDPELTYASVVRKNFIERGVEITGTAQGFRTNMTKIKPYATMEPFYVLEGKKVLSVAWWTNMKSVNIFAESLLQMVDYAKNGKSSVRKASDIFDKWLIGKVNTRGIYLNDGSGLSRSNAISANHFIELLTWINGSKINEEFRGTLPCAGVSGTLKGLCKGQAASGRMFAKSGTMARVKSYSGYINSVSGKKIAFALIVNNFNCTSAAVVDKMEPLFNELAKL